MNRTVREEIRAENLHFANEINSRSLEQYHQMLNAFNTQATLIVGFALSAINHDNLNALASDQSRYCVYAQRKPAWAYVFGCSTVACISISLTCIAASFYLMWRSQMYALHVGVRAAVAMVRIWLKSIVVIYLFGMLFFFLNIGYSLFAGKKAADNPWGEGAPTLEWPLSSPPPFHQFNELPRIA